MDRLSPHRLLLDGRPVDVESIADHTGGAAADLWTEDYAPDMPPFTDYRLEDEFPEVDQDLRGWSPLAPLLYGVRVPASAWLVA